MPDTRRHRGKAPGDKALFAPEVHDVLHRAAFELSWLLSRDYKEDASLKLVGDRYQLKTRQRSAVSRCACREQQRASRRKKRVAPADWHDRTLYLDGFNVLIILESALSGAMILRGRDGCHRDLAGIHGSYRRVEETDEALRLLGELFVHHGVERAVWLFDRPVSNSGRIKAHVQQAAKEHGFSWTAELEQNPDRALVEIAQLGSDDTEPPLVATSDGWIIDGCAAWADVIEATIDFAGLNPWIVDLDRPEPVDRVDQEG
jgi:hypothetical protein